MASQRELKIESTKMDDPESQPLRKSNRIDDPEGKELTQEEVVAEVKAGRMTWPEFKVFVISPKHRMFALLFLCACVVALAATFFLGKRVVKQFGTYEHGTAPELFRPRYFIWSTLISGGGLVSATYLAYVSELLKEQINRMRETNRKLKLNVERLAGSIEGLSQTAKSLGTNVKQLGLLNDQLKGQGDAESQEFGEILDKSTQVFDRIKQANKDQLTTLLKKIAQGCEFIDGEEGLSSEEYDAWKAHVEAPIELPKFEDVTSGKVASFEEIDAAIEKVIAGIA